MFDQPFPHGLVQDVFSPEVAKSLAEWIRATRTWQECDRAAPPRRAFYWNADGAPDAIAGTLTPGLMLSLRERVEGLFRARFKREFSVSANRYPAGHGIKIHNDYFPDPDAHPFFFTHRLIAYLSPGVDAGSGGLLGIFAGEAPEDRVRTIVPSFNSGSVMAMGPASFHAVSNVRAGVRYSIGFSFTNATGTY
ncbi:hypothetical protein KRM28CT15_18860 [Krasilnikovia sp. M28-CT-15]